LTPQKLFPKELLIDFLRNNDIIETVHWVNDLVEISMTPQKVQIGFEGPYVLLKKKSSKPISYVSKPMPILYFKNKKVLEFWTSF
jgi:hypothetical protein